MIADEDTDTVVVTLRDIAEVRLELLDADGDLDCLGVPLSDDDAAIVTELDDEATVENEELPEEDGEEVVDDVLMYDADEEEDNPAVSVGGADSLIIGETEVDDVVVKVSVAAEELLLEGLCDELAAADSEPIGVTDEYGESVSKGVTLVEKLGLADIVDIMLSIGEEDAEAVADGLREDDRDN
jgi:hypothetical protein